MNLLEKLRMFNRELVKENARLSKIYANMCESAAESGTDLNEIDEGIGKALAGAALGAGIGAAAGGAIKGATADTDLVKNANANYSDAAKDIAAAKTDVDAVTKATGTSDKIAIGTGADGVGTTVGSEDMSNSGFASKLQNVAGTDANITRDQFNAAANEFVKDKTALANSKIPKTDSAVKFAHDHAVAGGAAAGAIAGGAYGAMDRDNDDVDEAEDGMQDFNSFVKGAQQKNESEYSKYDDDRDPETGYIAPLKMSGEELFAENDDEDSSSNGDENSNANEKPEISDEEFFAPTMDEGDVESQIDDFFANEVEVDEDDMLTSRPTNGDGTHNGHKVEEGQSIPAGKFLGLVNETDDEKEASEFFKENDVDEDECNSTLNEIQDEDTDIPQEEMLAPEMSEREQPIDELDKGEMMSYDEFYNTDGDSDTVDSDDEDGKQTNESLKSFKRRR